MGSGHLYAPNGVVYHKDGRSIGHTNDPLRRSSVADYYNIGNRMVFTRKFFPWALPSVYIVLLITIANKIRRGQFDRAKMVLKLMLSGGPTLPSA